jgi:Asp-tRNA(Asn)/Glu-tRNA(Gln) amidotransferase A subunit family amidase
MLSIIDIARRIDERALTPHDAIRQSFEAIASRDGDVSAFVHVDRGVEVRETGPLSGIAVGIKDIVDTADMPTEMGSAIYAGWRPKADASVVAMLRRAGATGVGKTATTSFAYLDPAATRNPHNLNHTPGGSSSGSAAAVAAGMVPLAVGTQTGGSVIRPASYCGVAAIKPSFRLIPTVGVKCFSWTLDTLGLFAASIADVAFALAAVTDRADLRPDGAAGSAPRIGVVMQDFAGAPVPASAAALETAVRLVEGAGASVRTARLPDIVGKAFAAHAIVQDYEAVRALAWEYDRHREALPPLMRRLLEGAQPITAEAYDAARSTAHRARGKLHDAFGEFDAYLTFSSPGAAPETLASTGDSRFNRLWTLMGVPCVNVPGLTNGSGLPVGIQVIAPFGRDARALAVAAFVESALAKAR